MKELLAVIKALADENRLRAAMALTGGELCVCQLIELLGLAPSTVSRHMTVLHQAGLTQSRKDGRWLYYRLADEQAAPCARRALEWIQEHMCEDPCAREDAERLKVIRGMSREELCKHYRSC